MKEDTIQEMEMLTQEQVERFHRDGYLRYTRVISDEQIETLRAALERTIAEERERYDDAGLPPEFRYGHDRKGQEPGAGGRPARAIHQYVNIWKVVPEFREAIQNPTVTAAIRDLMGVPRLRLWHDQIISKPPGDNKKFAFHHDFYFWPMDRPTMITCWLALDDATVANGCMHVIPGSHRDPRFQPAGCDLSADIHLEPAPLGAGEPGSLYDAVRTWDVDKAKPVELKAGECMFHHCLNYHMTPENVTDRQRRSLILIYMPDGTRYNHAQSPRHPCTSYMDLADGSPYSGDAFPICG
jgi:ectoine hydroxylase-related dioxygenase (phytanoyl-CoA dioxygenase family)